MPDYRYQGLSPFMYFDSILERAEVCLWVELGIPAPWSSEHRCVTYVTRREDVTYATLVLRGPGDRDVTYVTLSPTAGPMV